MDTKLTLTINGDVIAQAKQVAKDSGRSLSDLVEHYLRSLVAMHQRKSDSFGRASGLMVAEPPTPVYSSRLTALKGIAKDDGSDYKKQLSEIKNRRFLK